MVLVLASEGKKGKSVQACIVILMLFGSHLLYKSWGPWARKLCCLPIAQFADSTFIHPVLEKRNSIPRFFASGQEVFINFGLQFGRTIVPLFIVSTMQNFLSETSKPTWLVAQECIIFFSNPQTDRIYNLVTSRQRCMQSIFLPFGRSL